MVRLFIRHKVPDYTEWRKGYDDFEATRISSARTATMCSATSTIGTMSRHATTLTASRRRRHSCTP